VDSFAAAAILLAHHLVNNDPKIAPLDRFAQQRGIGIAIARRADPLDLF
jgi:hypothetical protein